MSIYRNTRSISGHTQISGTRVQQITNHIITVYWSEPEQAPNDCDNDPRVGNNCGYVCIYVSFTVCLLHPSSRDLCTSEMFHVFRYIDVVHVHGCQLS